MPVVTKADDKFFYYDNGNKTAKNGLSKSKLDAMNSQVEKNSISAARDDRFDNQNSFESISDPMNLSRNDPAQMSVAPEQSVYGVPVNSNPIAVNPVTAQTQAPIARPTATQDLTPYNAPLPKTQVVTETVSGIPVSKKETAAISKNYNDQIATVKDLSKAQAEAGVEIAKANEAAQKEIDLIEYERSLIAEKKQQAVNDFDAKYSDTMKQIADAKIDPDRFYSGSVGKRVLAGIAIAFGSFGSAFTGQRNTALDIINKAIDDDINAQKEGVQKLGNQAQLQRQFLSDIRTKFADQDQAQLVQKAVSLEVAARKVAAITGNLSNQEQIAKGQMLASQLGNESLKIQMQLRQDAAGKAVTKTMQEFGGGGVDRAEAMKAVAPLRKELMDHPVTKATLLRRESLNTMQAAAAENSASGDLAFIYAYMKMLDPTSTVREGEFATAQNAGGISDNIRNQLNKVLSGERLNPEQRKSFLSTSSSIFDKQKTEQFKIDDQFTSLARRSGFDPNDVLVPWGYDKPKEKSQDVSVTFKPKSGPDRNFMKGR